MIDKKHFFYHLFSNIDWWLIFVLLILMLVSFIAIYSAGVNCGMSFKYLSVQFLASIMGFIWLFIFANFNYQHYKHFDKFIYILSLALLVSVLIFGSIKRGTRGWFDLGFISFQPVEIAKVMFILSLASFLDKRAAESRKITFLIAAFAMLAGHLVLIMMQPDFSSTLSYFPVTLVLLFMIGVKPFYLLCIAILVGLAAGIPLLETFLDMRLKSLENGAFLTSLAVFLKTGCGWLGVYIVAAVLFLIATGWYLLRKLWVKIPIIYLIILCGAILIGCAASIPVEKSLKDYQIKRLMVFLNPKIDPRGAGYNIIQSKIAIGSGRFTGKGFKRGTQTQLGFLPEQHTDFIFSVIGEEGGWITSQLILFLYFLFIWRALAVAKEARDRYGSLVAAGFAAMFTFYVVTNIGMAMGIMPVMGIPLLILSYGGSSIFSSLCTVGILCSIHMKRHTYY